MDVIKLLRSKNRCLRRLLDLTDRFLNENDLEALSGLQTQRDAIFKGLDLYDRKISEALSLLTSDRRTPELIATVQAILFEKDSLIQGIIRKDNELMARIDAKKAQLLEEVAASRKSRDLVGKFKSGWVRESGEEFDQKL
jgi:hypothetical protein